MVAPEKVEVKELNNVRVFTLENFPLWKYHMFMIFGTKDVEGIVLETKLKDEARDKTRWDKRDLLTRLCIFSTMGDKQMWGLIMCKTTTKMWAKLLSSHE